MDSASQLLRCKGVLAVGVDRQGLVHVKDTDFRNQQKMPKLAMMGKSTTIRL